MEKILRPKQLDADPSSSEASKVWLHWKKMFQIFLATLDRSVDKLGVLTNYLSPNVYQFIEDCADYDSAMDALQSVYVKPTNEVYARHLLATRRQQPNDTLDEYLQALKTLSKDCNYQSVTGQQHCEESIRDVFIAGLMLGLIHQRLLENKRLDLKTMFGQARSLESAPRSSESFRVPSTSFNAVALPVEVPPDLSRDSPSVVAPAVWNQKCLFCGNGKHSRFKCPARDAVCSNCQKKGHFRKVCRSGASSSMIKGTSAAMWPTLVAVTASVPTLLTKSAALVTVNGLETKALVDSGSPESFIHPRLVKAAALRVYLSSGTISMAASSLATKVVGHCFIDQKLDGRSYKKVRLSVLPNLCSDLILGLDFQSRHQSVVFQHGGPSPSFSVCGMSVLNTDTLQLFSNLTDDCRTIATKSHKYCRDDLVFIKSEMGRLLEEGIIEPSKSPWRAQVVLAKGKNYKRRMVIDY